MLSVPNVSNWLGFFNNSLIKNCNVLICKNGMEAYNYLLDKDSISSFSITSRNPFVPTQMPSDSCTIDIIKWSSLSSSDQEYLKTRGNFLKIFYTVENVDTTTCKVVMIDKCFVDRKGLTAQVTCVSPFKSMTNKNTSLDSTSQTPPFVSLPIDITVAEKHQHYAIAKGKGIKISNITGSETYTNQVTYVNMPQDNQVDTYFYLKNIYDDYTLSVEEEDKSHINLYGIASGTPVNLFSETTSPDLEHHFTATFTYSKQEVITSVTGLGTDPQGRQYSITPTVTYYADRMVFDFTSGYYVTVGFGAYGYDAELVKPSDNQNPYVNVPAIFNSDVSTPQTTIRRYFSNNEYCEFDCRIDPRLEPLDCISIEEIGIVCIEEIKIDFDGTFKGHIKGRKFKSQLLHPDDYQMDCGYDGEDFYFYVSFRNYNSVAVTLNISNNAGLETTYTVQANGTLTLDDVSSPELTQSFLDYYNGTLAHSLIAWYSCSGYADSQETIFLED